MGYKNSILFALLLASSTVYSATQSEQTAPLTPENSALFVSAHNQVGGDRFDSIAISFLVFAALGFVRRTNKTKTFVEANDTAPCENPKADIHLA